MTSLLFIYTAHTKKEMKIKEINYSIDLIDACENLRIEDVKTAIKNGADVNYVLKKYSTFPMLACIEYQQKRDYNTIIEIFRILLQNGADINLYVLDNETTLMHAAWLFRSYDVVKFLLENAANPNLIFDGETALDLTGCEISFTATCLDEPELVEELEKIYDLLVSYGAKHSEEL